MQVWRLSLLSVQKVICVGEFGGLANTIFKAVFDSEMLADTQCHEMFGGKLGIHFPWYLRAMDFGLDIPSGYLSSFELAQKMEMDKNWTGRRHGDG